MTDQERIAKLQAELDAARARMAAMEADYKAARARKAASEKSRRARINALWQNTWQIVRDERDAARARIKALEYEIMQNQRDAALARVKALRQMREAEETHG